MLGNSFLSRSSISIDPNHFELESRAANYLDPSSSLLRLAEKYTTTASSSSINSANNTYSTAINNSGTLKGFPSSIGEYGMGKLLGRGAFGSVYEVTKIRHETPLNDFKYAIKIMEKKSIKNEEMARRVRNEVALHKKLKHPNILSLYHYFEDDERVYLVMELCSRGELYTLLKRRKEDTGMALTETEARIILRDIVAGLKALHSRGIIHRDLKLSNILLSETGQAKIADFGLAVNDGDNNEGNCENNFNSINNNNNNNSSSNNNYNNNDNINDNRERTICGTPNYLAPEILHKRNYGRAADIWSLGCLLYSFLVGKPPFDSPNLPQTFDRVKRLDYHIPDHVSPAARDLISRLLSADPDSRPSFDQIIWHPFFNPAVTDALCTRRLGPLKQLTKYGNVEIFGDGRVGVDFLDSSDVLIISRDGLRVELLEKRTGTLTHLAAPFNNLPNNSLKRRYEYARRFVNLVKAKTPMIIISTPAFKAYLMENAAPYASLSSTASGFSGDFYMNYRDGRHRVEFCWVSRQLRILEGPNMHLPALVITDPSPQILSEIPDPNHRQILLEFLARYRQALQIRDGLLHPDGTERSKYRSTQFPITIKEEDFYSEIMNNSINNNNNNNNNINHNNSNSINNGINNQISNSPISTVMHNVSMFGNCLRKYIPEIGWCLISQSTSPDGHISAEHFLVLFNDGRCIQIDGAAETVLDAKTNRLLPINAQLPSDVKEMLALFSKFL